MNNKYHRLFHIKEPRLSFGYKQKMSDPRDGITLFGPYTKNKLQGQLSIGIIGTSSCRSGMKEYLLKIQKPIKSDGDVARPYFPGLGAAYGIHVNFNNLVELDIKRDLIDKYLKYSDGHQRVHNLSNLFVEKLNEYQKEEEIPVNVWLLVIPDEIYTFGRPKSHIPSSDKNVKDRLSPKNRKPENLFLFDFQNKMREAYDFEINFHNQVKAKLLESKIVTQIIRYSTIAYDKIWDKSEKIEAEKKFDTAKAWNIATTLYYKTGGLPWLLGDIRSNVCYIGIVYKKTHVEESNKNACCAAQMFLDSGDGVVFRGNIGPWYNPETHEFHISKEQAKEIIIKSLETFKGRIHPESEPTEIFIHARTDFNDEEWEGFNEAVTGSTKVVCIRIKENKVAKLYRDYSYSVPRGTVLSFDSKFAYLWTKGYIPRIQTQLGLETPNPLEIEIKRGEAQIDTVCRDILALTKLNYNACLYGEGLPVTLRFADKIGDILTAGRDINCGVLPFKHYV
ncbi:MAG: argonaute/piwi family protein [bacterium]